MTRILLAIGALGALLAAWFLFFTDSGDEETPRASQEAKAGEDSSKGSTPGTAASPDTEAKRPAAPLRMRSDRPAGTSTDPQAIPESLTEAFASETVDAAWAQRHRELVQETVDALIDKGIGSAKIEELDCRSRHCQMVLESLGGPSDPQLMQLVDALQDERGFLGKAEGIMLGRNEEGILMTLRFPAEGSLNEPPSEVSP